MVATMNLPTWRLLKVLYVQDMRYETMFLLQFELLIISSYKYLVLRTDFGTMPMILSSPGSKAPSSSVMSTLQHPQPILSPCHPRFVSSMILTLRYIYHIYFKEPELNSSRPRLGRVYQGLLRSSVELLMLPNLGPLYKTTQCTGTT